MVQRSASALLEPEVASAELDQQNWFRAALAVSLVEAGLEHTLQLRRANATICAR
jgi:hypothetical protein